MKWAEWSGAPRPQRRAAVSRQQTTLPFFKSSEAWLKGRIVWLAPAAAFTINKSIVHSALPCSSINKHNICDLLIGVELRESKTNNSSLLFWLVPQPIKEERIGFAFFNLSSARSALIKLIFFLWAGINWRRELVMLRNSSKPKKEAKVELMNWKERLMSWLRSWLMKQLGVKPITFYAVIWRN